MLKVLHLEDDWNYSYALREGLEEFGVEVVNFTDPNEGLEYFRQHPQEFDVIICDGSPSSTLGGDVVASELADINRRIPVIAQSDVPAYIQKMFNVGAVGSIPRTLKPTDFRRLEEVLRSISLKFPK